MYEKVTSNGGEERHYVFESDHFMVTFDDLGSIRIGIELLFQVWLPRSQKRYFQIKLTKDVLKIVLCLGLQLCHRMYPKI